MRQWSMLLIATALSAAPAHAASRFYCGADDGNIKLSLDSGFEETAFHKLNHFRGAMVAKSADVPAGLKGLALDSSQLVHHWYHDGDLRLEVYAQGEERDAGQSFDLVVMANEKSGAAAIPGSYVVTYNIPGRPQPLQFQGRLTCSAK